MITLEVGGRLLRCSPELSQSLRATGSEADPRTKLRVYKLIYDGGCYAFEIADVPHHYLSARDNRRVNAEATKVLAFETFRYFDA